MSSILERIKEYIDIKGITIAAFERSVGMSNASFGKSLKNKGAIGTDKLENILTAYPDISPTWLLTGAGSMILDQHAAVVATPVSADDDGIPLIPFEAMAGVFRGEISINESQCERLSIPGVRANFVIPISGNSMEPRYYSGDMVACQSMALDDVFFQWGRVYVIDTEQGVLIKRVTPGSDDATVTLVSENTFYPPFEIPRASIYHIALVKALVRIE
jgi:phage repressor protein C with HTH and peptisase S24 domain